MLRQALSRYFSVPSGAFRSFRCLIYKVHAASAERCLVYQKQFSLSRTFFKFFQTFLFRHLHSPFSWTAQLEYHTTPHLVNTFFHFFRVFSQLVERPFHPVLLLFFLLQRQKIYMHLIVQSASHHAILYNNVRTQNPQPSGRKEFSYDSVPL